MSRFTKHGKKLELLYIAVAVISFALMFLLIPWFSKSYVIESTYDVVAININGDVVATVEDVSTAEEIYLSARKQIMSDATETIYIDAAVTFEETQSHSAAETDTEVVYNEVYNYLLANETSYEETVEAYEVDIDGTIYALSTLEEVEELLNASMEAYDEESLFHVEVKSGTKRFSTYEVSLVKASTSGTAITLVTAAEDGASAGSVLTEEEEYLLSDDGVVSMEFVESITITSATVSTDEVVEVDDAVSEVLKETEENTIYTVVKGDTLSAIAAKYGLTVAEIVALNNLSDQDYINIGDQLIVTVPTPEVSVLVCEKQTYDESYYADVQYVYDSTKYSTYSTTVQAAVAGTRNVVAIVTYKNGVEVSREIISSTVITEPVAQIICVGTLTPPRFIKPITGGVITQYFGSTLYGSAHKGVDWYVPVGTSVRAAASGTVVSAGWNGVSGYTIVILHADGSKTVYKHLSRILVSSGQYVTQNTQIALSGATGSAATGPHLHFEIIIGGVNVNPLNYVS